MIAEYILIFTIGLLIGSFLNVCIYRIPKEESVIFPRSYCRNCKGALHPRDLIPLFSFLLLKGRCRKCQEKISLRYFMVELFTGLIYIALFYRFGISTEFLIAIFLTSILTIVFFIDVDYSIIPNKLVIVASVGGIIVGIYNIFCNVEFYGDRNIFNPLLGVLVGSGFLLLVALTGFIIYKSDDALGMGDVKIFIPIGLMLGWRLTIVVLFISIILAGVVSLALIMLKIKSRKETMPFGPFISAASIFTMFFGWDVIMWYCG